MDDFQYVHFLDTILHLLSIPASNAGCEKIISLDRCIKTDFKSVLHPDTVSSLIGVHFNFVFNCLEYSDFEPSFLDTA